MATVYGELRENSDRNNPVYSPTYTTTTTDYDAQVHKSYLGGTVELQYKLASSNQWETVVLHPIDINYNPGTRAGAQSINSTNLPIGTQIRLCAYIGHGGFVRYSVTY